MMTDRTRLPMAERTPEAIYWREQARLWRRQAQIYAAAVILMSLASAAVGIANLMR